MRTEAFRLGRLVPAAIIAVTVTSIATLVVSDILAERALSESFTISHESRSRTALAHDLAILQKDIELDIVSTQESLTDISATRGLDGLNDGFALAEESAISLRGKVEEARKLAMELEAAEVANQLDKLREQYEAFYAAGVNMAETYVASGPEGGNKLMEPFDAVADKMQEEIEAAGLLVSDVSARIEDASEQRIANLEARAHFEAMVKITLGILTLLASIALVVFIQKRLMRPLVDVTKAMNALAKGDMEASVSGTQRGDEMGDLARAFTDFRNSALQKDELARQNDENRDRTEREPGRTCGCP